LRFDQRILLLSLAAGFPAVVVALLLLWSGGQPARVQWTVGLLVIVAWVGGSFVARRRVFVPLQTLANLLAAVRERDFSIRARSAAGAAARERDPLAAVMIEVNDLSAMLHDQRLGAIEAGALLRTVMLEIDVAVFTFDAGPSLRLVNRAGERLLGVPADRLLGRTAEDIGLQRCLEGATPRIEAVTFPGGSGRWEVRRTTFRQEGRPHQLVVLADVSRPLRDEERQAWQRLIRVIGHEINNSLAPIKSIAGSLQTLVGGNELPDHRDDMRRGLAVIAARSEALSRFTTAYAQLAKLPSPQFVSVNVGDLVRRAASIETRAKVEVAAGPDATVLADPVQLEQLLINIMRNGVDAAIETAGGVRAGWRIEGTALLIYVEDEGKGLTNASNLFVPFYTTKPGGSGIGLVLSQQIAETHGGTLTLENRADRSGCIAKLRLPQGARP
jgi:nitrogen fixation/metabolism regulation signal transduction histidine kinase